MTVFGLVLSKEGVATIENNLTLCSSESVKKRCSDPGLCCVEILLVISILLLIIQEFWQSLALKKQYFKVIYI